MSVTRLYLMYSHAHFTYTVLGPSSIDFFISITAVSIQFLHNNTCVSTGEFSRGAIITHLVVFEGRQNVNCAPPRHYKTGYKVTKENVMVQDNL